MAKCLVTGGAGFTPHQRGGLKYIIKINKY